MKPETAEPLILEFLKNVSLVMEQNKISKAELARRLETSYAYITKIFRGENLTLRTINKISKALNCQTQITLISKSQQKGTI
jgi:DNA-binding Xre family transcriptional regulator